MNTETMTQMMAEYFKTQPVLKAWLFGSFARGEQTQDSDIDILVVLDHSQPVGLKFFGMYEDLKEMLGRNVDLVVDRSLASFARESVERDKILIYERAALRPQTAGAHAPGHRPHKPLHRRENVSRTCGQRHDVLCRCEEH